mgnify:CR=1 FL=1
MKSSFKILIIFYLFFVDNSYSKISNNILLKVGNKIITNYEVKNKILISLILSNKEINQNNINKIKKDSVDSLIQKKIKELELDKYNFDVDNVRVDNYLKSISAGDVSGLKKKFKDNNINFELFLEEIIIQFKWQQLILNKYSKKIKINQENLDKEIKKILKEKQNIQEFKLSEIEIPINNNSKDNDKINNLINLINEIGFENVALKFSISSTAENKGDLGWINSTSLSNNIYETISKLKVGQISSPIIRQGSVTILKLNDIRNSNINNLNQENLRQNLIKNKKNELFNLYSQSLLSKLKNSTLIEYINE